MNVSENIEKRNVKRDLFFIFFVRNSIASSARARENNGALSPRVDTYDTVNTRAYT